jgi:hypothetical protein
MSECLETYFVICHQYYFNLLRDNDNVAYLIRLCKIVTILCMVLNYGSRSRVNCCTMEKMWSM